VLVTALRVQPGPELLESVPAAASEGDKPEKGEKAGKGERGGKRGGKARKYVYLVGANNRLRAVPVRVGISDLLSTTIEEIEPGSLPEGTEVLTAILRDAEAATTNPFAPPRMAGGRNPR
jgi:hypothetical protein